MLTDGMNSIRLSAEDRSCLVGTQLLSGPEKVAKASILQVIIINHFTSLATGILSGPEKVAKASILQVIIINHFTSIATGILHHGRQGR